MVATHVTRLIVFITLSSNTKYHLPEILNYHLTKVFMAVVIIVIVTASLVLESSGSRNPGYTGM